MQQNRADFPLLIRKSTGAAQRREVRRRFLRRRRKCLQLVEELSLRTRRVQPLIRQLQHCLERMEAIRARLRIIRRDPLAKVERDTLRRELYHLFHDDP